MASWDRSYFPTRSGDPPRGVEAGELQPEEDAFSLPFEDFEGLDFAADLLVMITLMPTQSLTAQMVAAQDQQAEWGKGITATDVTFKLFQGIPLHDNEQSSTCFHV